jgi:hypothetical protein
VPAIITATNSKSPTISCCIFSHFILPELNPQENLWDKIPETIFKNYALKSMEDVYAKIEEAALYIERNPALVKPITSFPYIVRSICHGTGMRLQKVRSTYAL